MRKLLIVCALLAAALPLRGQEPGGGGVGALGQAVKRPPAPTGPVPRLPDGSVDLNGVWVGGGPVGDLESQGGLKKGEVDGLLLPWAKDLLAYRAIHEEQDPHYFCMPMGVPRSTPYPFRFVQNYTDRKATHMFLMHEGNIHTYRQIFMDGRTHPADLDPSWFGHSIGHWEGDTLVIDTVGLNDKFWIDRAGFPQTEQLHMVERWTRVNYTTMRRVVTLDDKGAFTKPITATFEAHLAQPGSEIFEYFCIENEQFGARTVTDPHVRTYGN